MGVLTFTPEIFRKDDQTAQAPILTPIQINMLVSLKTALKKGTVPFISTAMTVLKATNTLVISLMVISMVTELITGIMDRFIQASFKMVKCTEKVSSLIPTVVYTRVTW